MLAVHDAAVRYGDTVALDGVDLTVGAGETVAVLGPSGCGKSTLLRAIAGLEPLARGRVTWEGRDLAGTPPHERGFGLMFQDYALFPHRDVRGNVDFGPRMAGLPAAARAERVRDVIALVGLTGFERRRVATLAGGEQQRVALARALAAAPRLLMLDEPLGSLDRTLHDRLLVELRDVLAASGVPVVHVTHDHEEAFALADRLVVMRAGRALQTGPPGEVWRRPATEWVATFLGFGPRLEATIEGDRARTAVGTLRVPTGSPSGPATLVPRPDSIRVGAGGLAGVVKRRTFAGDRVVLELAVAPGAPALEARVPLDRAPRALERVTFDVDPAGVLVYPRDA
jgi:thiamine transport system ATP-binding protein